MREYCCPECGLIWFKKGEKLLICPECKNTRLYAVDTFGFYYAKDGIRNNLKEKGMSIHYHEEHPWFYKNEGLKVK